MAPVIVELGARSGLVIPLIAVHLFVFYFGIMARRHAAGGAGLVRGGGDLGRGPDRDRLAGHLVQPAHGGAAVRLHLQSAAAADRRGLVGRGGDRLRHAAPWRRCCSRRPRCAGSAPAAPGSRSALLLVATFLFFRPDWVIDRFSPKYVQRAGEPRSTTWPTRLSRRRVAGGRHRRARRWTASRRPRPSRFRWARAPTAASGCATPA